MGSIYSLESSAFDVNSFHKDLVDWFSPSLLKNITNSILSSFPVLANIYEPSFFPYALTKWFYDTFNDAVSQRQQNKSFQPNNFLTFLLGCQSNYNHTNENLAAFAATFFFDAFETSSMMLAQALYNIANNKNCEEKLRAEIIEKFPLQNQISADDINKTPYLDNVINGLVFSC